MSSPSSSQRSEDSIPSSSTSTLNHVESYQVISQPSSLKSVRTRRRDDAREHKQLKRRDSCLPCVSVFWEACYWGCASAAGVRNDVGRFYFMDGRPKSAAQSPGWPDISYFTSTQNTLEKRAGFSPTPTAASHSQQDGVQLRQAAP